MLYQRRTFTLPASNQASDIQWDYTFASKKEFIAKHGISKEHYLYLQISPEEDGDGRSL